jgi:glyoxylase-like metal-dependent hydrolase (beta-lactamase superfamily II)
VIDFSTGAPIDGDLNIRWIHGASRSDPPIQVHAYDEHTFVLRQSKAVHYEAPFIFLLCGNERALLLDTGATADERRFPLRATVDRIMASWLTKHPRQRYELIVAHTHGHGDHVQGDVQFQDRDHTTVVPPDLAAVQRHFGFDRWPASNSAIQLGGRTLDVIGIPGHQQASIAVYDPWSGWLLTGDTVLPGRIYVPDFPAFTDSLTRLVDFAATRHVTWVLGCHVEMTTTPRRDYPIGTTYQPRERPLQFPPGKLTEIRDAARKLADKPGATMFDDFAIYHGPCRAAIRRQRVRRMLRRVIPPAP